MSAPRANTSDNSRATNEKGTAELTDSQFQSTIQLIAEWRRRAQQLSWAQCEKHRDRAQRVWVQRVSGGLTKREGQLLCVSAGRAMWPPRCSQWTSHFTKDGRGSTASLATWSQVTGHRTQVTGAFTWSPIAITAQGLLHPLLATSSLILHGCTQPSQPIGSPLTPSTLPSPVPHSHLGSRCSASYLPRAALSFFSRRVHTWAPPSPPAISTTTSQLVHLVHLSTSSCSPSSPGEASPWPSSPSSSPPPFSPPLPLSCTPILLLPCGSPSVLSRPPRPDSFTVSLPYRNVAVWRVGCLSCLTPFTPPRSVAVLR